MNRWITYRYCIKSSVEVGGASVDPTRCKVTLRCIRAIGTNPRLSMVQETESIRLRNSRLCLTYISVCSVHNYGQQSVDRIACGTGVQATARDNRFRGAGRKS